MIRKFVCAWAIVILSTASVASAEDLYISIGEMRESTGERLCAVYEGKNTSVSVDAPIVLPQQDQLPALTVQRTELSEFADFYEDTALEKLDIGITYVAAKRNLDGNYPEVNPQKGLEIHYKLWQEQYAEDNPYSPEDAQTLVQDVMKYVLGWEAGIDYQFSAIQAQSRMYLFDEKSNEILHPLTDTGSYVIELQQVFHGSTLHWKGLHFINDTVKTSRDPFPPSFSIGATVFNDQCFSIVWANVMKEVDLLAEDIPLLPFSSIQDAIRGLVQSGRMIRVDEIRLCDLVLFVTPDGSKDVFQAMPCWRVTGLVTEPGSKSLPESQGWIMINAQTGAVIDPESTDPHRARANELITWDQLTE